MFVRDRYAGFEVKTFTELTDSELGDYIERNVAAVREVVDRAGGVDAALANHLVMGPVVLARAGLTYALKVHGSDLSYTVLPEPGRFGPYAAEATDGAAGILVGSSHIAARLRAAIDDPAVSAKVRLGPPGVDTDVFRPPAPGEARARLSALAKDLRRVPQRDAGEESGSWDRDTAHAATAVERFAEADGPRVVFVGKLIVSKGVDLLLAAWPLVHGAHPGARLLIAGFGEFRSGLEALWQALCDGDEQRRLDVARRGRALEGGPEAPLGHLTAFLASRPTGYDAAARAAAGSVDLAGRLEHDEVGQLVPAADALVFPSTFPEAFGMVAAEAAAASVLPISAAHSGALEVSRALAAELPAEAAPLVSFPVDDDAVAAIASRLNGWLGLDAPARESARRSLRHTATRLWGWEGVAAAVIAASAGRLDGLPRVSD